MFSFKKSNPSTDPKKSIFKTFTKIIPKNPFRQKKNNVKKVNNPVNQSTQRVTITENSYVNNPVNQNTQRITNTENLYNVNNLNYGSRNGSRNPITLENIKENLPMTYKIHTHKLIGSEFGKIYIYKNPKVYTSENTTINSNETINKDNKMLWEYYMLNNFLFTKELYDKKINKSNTSSNIYSDTYPLQIYPFKESIEESDKELNLNRNEELKRRFSQITNNKGLLENKKREKKNIELKLKKLTNNITKLETNINIENKDLKKRKIESIRDKELASLNKTKILLSKKIFKKDKLNEILLHRIDPESETNKLKLEQNIQNLKSQKNELEQKLIETEKIVSSFEEIRFLTGKSKLIKTLLDELISNRDNVSINKLVRIKKVINFYKNKEVILNGNNGNNGNNIMRKISNIYTSYNKNNNKIKLINNLKNLKSKLIEELNLINEKIDKKSEEINRFNVNHQGGFVDPFSGTILVILSFITMLYVHFIFIIKLFANYILVSCSIEMKNSSRTEVLKNFIKTNFKDLFITYILVITFTAIGPLGLILNHVILFGITKYIASKALFNTSKKNSTKSGSEQKFDKTLNFLCNKGKTDKSIISTIKNISNKQISAKKFQLKCLTSSMTYKDRNATTAPLEENNNEDIDLYRLILISKQNNIYRFNIINLLDDTILGHIEANADIVEKIYLTQNKVSSTITKEKEDEIFNYVNIFSGQVNENYHNFINFLRELYKPKSA